ncbi:protein phosphatase 1 regulatory subunit 42-like [Anopheles ziemanni]|uniref:protein phosphatase 1 regulatory subunit 42-like n=1 Tax=Anopheles coustani TaxID=139045 RepID=UPI00265912DB|nr:protein phosphatase 1 regulatory subunit 42-like [Anopheles coustani]XP_058168790.1 protein phosphatase 1 regulatory subunit 42-like [Anopheles ziemanni]
MTKHKVFSKKAKTNLTHLYLNDKNMTKINTIYPTKNILVLYLHNNQISKIEKLGAFAHLTHLYLQWNNLRKIENLESLKNLKQLYLGYNKITRLENLGGLKKLEQVHIERQQLDGTMRFEFDPECLCALANHLKVLNIKKLKLANIDALEPLWKLEILLASENNFKSTEDVTPVVSALYSLRVLDLQGCSAQRDVHYREKVTAAAGHKLLLLDGKMISQSTRNFIKNFQNVKLEKQRRASEKPKTAENTSKSSFESVSERSSGAGGSGGGGGGGSGGSGGFVDPFSAALPHQFPGNSLFQVSTRRPVCTRVLRKPIKSPLLTKTMSANFCDEMAFRSNELHPAAAVVMLQGKEIKAGVPVFKDKLRAHRKIQSLPTIDH